ncbi:MAG TPA: thiamine-phosphate pyrophosphorylase [Candidatus Omnitrophota bacterium]|nr:thiamine-phosphate pyrophosphorylase [Candidatus Omnitrophota bacterium]HPN55935.1 thiamine-phosphate pyrophosphorylase [Candidatus Omnitrophota bacterium]
MRKKLDKNIYRVIDANFNRAKEGLRVCEDVCRFVWDSRSLTKQFKDLRHALTEAVSVAWRREGVATREVRHDEGRFSVPAELTRSDVTDIFYANSQRVKESIRVLEEFAKLFDPRQAEALKRLRYRVYILEQKGLLPSRGRP